MNNTRQFAYKSFAFLTAITSNFVAATEVELQLTVQGQGQVSELSSQQTCNETCSFTLVQNALAQLTVEASEGWMFDDFDQQLCSTDTFGNLAEDSKLLSSSGSGAKTLLFEDFDGDGLEDAVMLWLFSDRVSLQKNNAAGFESANNIASGLSYGSALDAYDWDGDGDMDVVIADFGAQAIYVYTNDGTATFSLSLTVQIDEITPYAIAVADLNNDQLPDLLISSFDANIAGDLRVLENSIQNARLAWYVNQGEDQFSLAEIVTQGEGIITLDIGDIDGDADLDVAAASITSDRSLWYESVDDTYVEHLIAEADGMYGIALGDINQDARLDVISTAYWSRELLVNFQLEGGQFSVPISKGQHADGLTAAAFGDINGDGIDDLGSAVFNTNQFFWLENSEFENCHFFMDDNKSVIANFTQNNPPVEPPIVSDNTQSSSGGSWSIIGVLGIILVFTQRRFLSVRFS